MRFRLPVLERGVAYVGASLFLPRSAIAETPIRRALTFGAEISPESTRELARIHPYHLEVPRNFLSDAALRDLGVPVVDVRPDQFSHSSLRPKSGFSLYPNQIPIWEAMLRAKAMRGDGILRVDTGRGKTVLGLRFAAEVGGPVLVTSAQEAHLHNWEKELREGFDLDGPVGWVIGDKMDYRREVVFSTVQTLVKRAREGRLPYDFHSRFALVIHDETHHLAPEYFATINDVTAGQRLGLTATLTRVDRCEGVVLYHIGPVIYDDPGGDTLVPDVFVHETGVVLAEDDPDVLDCNGQPNVSRLRGKLGRLPARNQKIVEIVRKRISEGHVAYVLSHSKEHVFALADALRAAGFDPGVITGDEKDAKKRLQQLNKGCVVVATLYVGKENYNRPALSEVLFATPLAVDPYAPTQFTQAAGRTLRPLAGKRRPVIDLLADRDVGASFGMLQSVLSWCRTMGWKVEGDEWTKRKSARAHRAWAV